MLRRARRNRKSPAIRAMIQETRLGPQDLVQGFFVIEGSAKRVPINSLPGIDRLSIDLLVKEAKKVHDLGVPAIILFPVIESGQKDEIGSAALKEGNLIAQAINAVKAAVPSLCVIADVALDPYTSHGHDGLIGPDLRILNDETVELLAEVSLLFAKAGADIIAPSDMMDGRVQAIRKKLDSAQFQDVSIMAYTAKYASSFYGPFRDALDSAPRLGHKRSYQLDPANAREALLESYLDECEGADFIMVKPALAYLDIIAKVREKTSLPVAAYNVSGEYSMVMAAAKEGWLDGQRTLYEILLSIKRAGADIILTYAAPQALEYMQRCKSSIHDF